MCTLANARTQHHFRVRVRYLSNRHANVADVIFISLLITCQTLVTIVTCILENGPNIFSYPHSIIS